MRRLLLAALCALAFLIPTAAPAAAATVSVPLSNPTFDVSVRNWTANGGASATWNSAGHNASGSMTVSGPSGGEVQSGYVGAATQNLCYTYRVTFWAYAPTASSFSSLVIYLKNTGGVFYSNAFGFDTVVGAWTQYTFETPLKRSATKVTLAVGVIPALGTFQVDDFETYRIDGPPGMPC